MSTTSIRSAVALALSLHLGIATAGSPAIGTALARGAFRVNQETIHGNATLLEGSVVETADASAALALNSGARLSLAPGSRGRLFGDRLVLEQGSTNLETTGGFRLVALGLTIQPTSAATGAVVFDSPRRVRVSASHGSLRVLNSSGTVIANLAGGSALAFEPQAGPSNVVRVSGTLEQKSGRFLLTDEVTKVTVEVTGEDLGKWTGHKVEVTGVGDPAASPAKGASQVVHAKDVRKADVAIAAGTGGAASGSGTGSGALVTTVAVVGGVAAAATVGGLAAADSNSGSPAPNSR